MKASPRLFTLSLGRMLLAVAVLVALAAGTTPLAAAVTQIDIVGPPGSGAFGTSVTVLPNGNFVVTDPYYDAGTTEDVGAVYLYHGATGALISTLTGSTFGDHVGGSGVTVLNNGNYVVRSPSWHNGTAMYAGAVTWGSATTGVSGVVSAANSLVGSTDYDDIGSSDGIVVPLNNGNYVVTSIFWDNGAAVDAGAATWGNGMTGTSGVVSAANSLVGSSTNDQVGYDGVTALNSGNYVVASSYWDNGTAADAGAATWGDGTSGVSGPVSVANSLVGTTTSDRIGRDVTMLGNGNYVVSSSIWDNGSMADAGAVTWGNGTTGIKGEVSAANSLVGARIYDYVGSGGVTALTNGNYVVCSSNWDRGTYDHAGAVTWGNGLTGIVGPVSAANSLVGGLAGNQVGADGVTALSNGNYVVVSSWWNYGTGAVTWGNGTTGVKGTVSAANSLVGSTTYAGVGSGGVTALVNGHYVVLSPDWDNGATTDVGAVTWQSGTAGTSGAVSAANSLRGTTAGDRVGSDGVTALSNGNYVVCSAHWSNGAAADIGAATWGNGTTGIIGVVSAANSLVGSSANDRVAFSGVTALSNGNYVVRSAHWSNGAAADAGAVSWGNGATGTSGIVSAANSLVGSTAGDRVGYLDVTVLSNSNYVVGNYLWHNGAAADAGAVTWGNGTTGIKGEVSAANSLVGTRIYNYVSNGGVTALANGDYVVSSPSWQNDASINVGAVTWGDGIVGTVGPITPENSVLGTADGSGLVWAYDHRYPVNQIVVGRPADNIVTLFVLPRSQVAFLPVVLKNAP